MESQENHSLSLEFDADECNELLHLLHNWNENGDTEEFPDTTRLAIKMLQVLTDFFE